MTANIVPIRESETERLWSAYLVAKNKADASRRIEDAIAAGRAWAAFLEIFVGEGQKHG
jgi:hypothetical protein